MGKKHMHKQFGNCYISNAYTVYIQEEHSAGSIYMYAVCGLPAKHNFSSGSQQPGSQGYFCLSKEQSAFKAPFEYMFVCVCLIPVFMHKCTRAFSWNCFCVVTSICLWVCIAASKTLFIIGLSWCPGPSLYK